MTSRPEMTEETVASETAASPVVLWELNTLRSLRDELGDSRPVARFLSTYLSMLPGRVLRISKGLCQHDTNATLDAVLSLKISSAMVGAMEAESQCRAMESMIRNHCLASAAEVLPALRSAAERCLAAAPQVLGNAAAGAPHHLRSS